MKNTLLTVFSVVSLFLGQAATIEGVFADENNGETSAAKSIDSTISSENGLLDPVDPSLENSQEVTQETTEESTSETTDTSQETAETNTSTEETAEPIEASQAVSPKAATIVTSWEELSAALGDTTVSQITVSKDLQATKDILVNRAVSIDFGKHVVNFSTYSIIVDDKADLKVSDLTFTGSKTAFRGNKTYSTTLGTIQFTGTITAQTTNTGAFLTMPGGTALFSAAEFTYSNSSAIGVMKPGLDVKNLTITNGTIIKSTAAKFVATTDAADVGGNYIIDGGSIVSTNDTLGSLNTSGQIWKLSYTVTFSVTGPGTKLLIETNYTNGRIEGNGAFVIGSNYPATDNANSKLSVTNSAEFTINSETSTAMYFNGTDSSIEVSQKGSLAITQKSEIGKSTNEALRLGSKTNNKKISVSDQGVFKVTKEKGLNAALYISGDNNEVSVTSGADFIVKQLEPAPQATSDDAKGQAIIFRSSLTDPKNTFTSSGTNTNIELISSGGGVIQQSTNNGPKGTLGITVGPGVYFVARGKVSNHVIKRTEGLFEANVLNFNLDQPKYYDIRNNNGELGAMFIGETQSTFNTTNSTISFWKDTANLDGNASHFWKNATFAFSGKDLGTLSSTSIAEMNTVFTTSNTLTNYARISANNQLGQIDALRKPTDADRYLYAHASFPEGKYDESRDAMADEVKLTLGVYDSENNEIKKVAGNTQGEFSIYGEAVTAGWTKIPYEGLLTAGTQIKVLQAQLLDEANQPTITLPAEDLLAEPQTVVDVTPPEPIKAATSVLAPNTRTISGTGEPEALISLEVNGAAVASTTSVKADGTFELVLPETVNLKIGDVVQVFAKDHAGKVDITNPPITNDAVGNIEPKTVADFHDTSFKAATILPVDGMLSFISAPNILFGMQSVTTKEQTYRPEQIEGQLAISDTRGTDKNTVRLYLKESEPLKNADLQLTDGLRYTNQAGETQIVSSQGILVEEYSAIETVIVSDYWNKENGTQAKGFSLTVPVEKQKAGAFHGELEWSLQTVPANN